MKLESIKRLEIIEINRKSSTGYMVNKERVRIDKKSLRDVTIIGDYSNLQFDKYIIKAILEKECVLLERAFELEQIDYEETKKLAKIEAANVLVWQQLI